MKRVAMEITHSLVLDQPQASFVCLDSASSELGECAPKLQRTRLMNRFRESIQERIFAYGAKIRELHEELSEDAPPLAGREIAIFLVAAFSLVVFHYYGMPYYFNFKLLPKLLEAGYFRSLEPGYHGLTGYVWWAGSSVLWRVLLPLLFIFLIFRESPRQWGLGLGSSLRHAWIYLLLYLLVLPFLWFASQQPDFQAKYPFYRAAAEGGVQLWVFELCYAVQFLAVEVFFRGFLLFGLYRRFGYYAIAIMLVPYCLIHFGKPMPETLAALGAGLVLAFLALKSGSVYMGALLHGLVALTMDLLAIWSR